MKKHENNLRLKTYILCDIIEQKTIKKRMF